VELPPAVRRLRATLVAVLVMHEAERCTEKPIVVELACDFENMVGAGWRVAATPLLLLLLGGLTHRSPLQDVCHWSEVVDWTYRNAWESEAI
jgi:hypothetical protein